jgi:hypothetical protein
LRCDIAQQGIKRHARLAQMDRIDPDKYAVHRQQLVADRVGEGFVIDRRACLDADSSERFEDADEPAVLRGRVPPRRNVSAREDSNGVSNGLSFGVHVQAPRRIVSRRAWTEQSDGESACPHDVDSMRLGTQVSR